MSNLKSAKQYFFVLTLAVLAALFVRASVIEVFKITTTIMAPNLLKGDLVFVWKPGLGFSVPLFGRSQTALPSYGSVVVYTDGTQNYIKRVLALPGDSVQILNDQFGFQSSRVPSVSTGCGKEHHPKKAYDVCKSEPSIENLREQIVPKGHIFVATDHRTRRKGYDSLDIIPVSKIVGEAKWVWFSIDPDQRGKIRWNRFFKTVP